METTRWLKIERESSPRHQRLMLGGLRAEGFKTDCLICCSTICVRENHKPGSSRRFFFQLALSSFISVLEASDVDNLLDQFEAVENIRKDLTNNSNADPDRASHIVAAVKSHFSGSNRNFPKGKVPKIGKSYP